MTPRQQPTSVMQVFDAIAAREITAEEGARLLMRLHRTRPDATDLLTAAIGCLLFAAAIAVAWVIT